MSIHGVGRVQSQPQSIIDRLNTVIEYIASYKSTSVSKTHHDEVHVALVAERSDELRVLRVLAVLRQAAKACRPAVEGLGAPVAILLSSSL